MKIFRVTTRTLADIYRQQMSPTEILTATCQSKRRAAGFVLGGWAWLTFVTLAVIGRPSAYNSAS